LVTIFVLLTLSSAVPTSKHGPPIFPTDNNYTITTNGRHGNGAGPHKITQSAVKRAGEISESIKARQGYGTASGAALNWYSSDFNTGGSGYADSGYYYCFGGSAADFPPFENWMNFYDMFDLNQNTQMVYEESGPIQGAIWNAIVSVSESALVDARFILAIIMQEVCFPHKIEATVIILLSQLEMSTFHALATKIAVLCKVPLTFPILQLLKS
jgi:hypothetical protein